MITLVTGNPGNGKTAYVVDQLLTLLDAQKKNPELPRRPVLSWGIPDLKVDHQVAPPFDQWTEQVPSPEDRTKLVDKFSLPQGAIVVVDECQTLFRVRASASKVPPQVSAFERHRHQGLDFFLITQKPSLIDANVRALVGRHIHIDSNWAGRRLFEWAECKSPSSKIDQAEAIKRRYKLPKRVFDLYKSADEHHKPKRRFPVTVAVLGVSLLALGGTVWYMRNRMHQMTTPAVQQATPEQVARHEPPAPGGAGVSASRKEERQQVIAWIESYTFVAVGGKTLNRTWIVRDDQGRTMRLHDCRGEGYEASCSYRGLTVSGSAPVERVQQVREEPRFARNGRL
jgi:zona occludens toxin